MGKLVIVIMVLFVVFMFFVLVVLLSIGEFISDMIKKDGLIFVYYDDESDKVYLVVLIVYVEYLF